jgi:hypothetical protein
MRALIPVTASENDAACGPVSGAMTPILMLAAVTPGSSTHGFGASMCTRLANGPDFPGAAAAVVGEPPDDLLLLLHAPATTARTAATAAIERTPRSPVDRTIELSPEICLPVGNFAVPRNGVQPSDPKVWHARSPRAAMSAFVA